MSKKKKNKENLGGRRAKLGELRREIRLREKEIIADCSHQDRKGNFTIHPIGSGIYECEECGEKFSMDKVGNKEIQAAIQTIHNAINQIRILADLRKPKDVVISKTVGALNFDVKEIAELYERIVRRKGKENKNHKRDRRKKFLDSQDSLGDYENDLTFIRRHKKEKKRNSYY